MTALTSKSRRQLDGFMIRLMEPVSDDELIDTQYNSILRQTRRRSWRKAEQTAAYFKGLLDMVTATESNFKPSTTLDLVLPNREKCVDLYRSALVEQLLTPVETKGALDWKRRLFEKRGRYLPVRPEKVIAAIEADEQFLARHPVTRKGARRDG